MKLVGQLKWVTDKDIYIDVLFDKIALHGNQLAVLSCVGSTPNVKALRAGFGAQLKDAMKLYGPDARYAIGLMEGSTMRSESNCWAFAGGYTVSSYRLGKDTVHALFVAKTPGLLLNRTDEALWQDLKHERFETPLLRSWVPYLRERLIADNKLIPCKTAGCDVWGLRCNTQDLDVIVVDGVKSGMLKIEEVAA